MSHIPVIKSKVIAALTQIKKRVITPQSKGKRKGGSSTAAAVGRSDECIKNMPPTQTTADKVCTAINKAISIVVLQKIGPFMLTGLYSKSL
jgi:hypothetical protein